MCVSVHTACYVTRIIAYNIYAYIDAYTYTIKLRTRYAPSALCCCVAVLINDILIQFIAAAAFRHFDRALPRAPCCLL